MKLAHVAAASTFMILGSVAVAQITISKSACANCNAYVLLPSGCGGGITVAPEPIEIEKDKDATITWSLVNSDWVFADGGKTGIVIKHPANGVALKAASPTKVTWSLPKLPTGKIHKYDINLVKKDSNPPEKCSRDPTIVNH